MSKPNWKKMIEMECSEETGMHRVFCPRCGKRAMNPVPEMNALSRYANAYICSDCGVAESLNGILHDGYDGELQYWAIFYPEYGAFYELADSKS